MGKWEMVRLGDVSSIQAGGTPSRSKQDYWKNGNIRWIKISDMRGRYVTKTEESITEQGLKNSSAKIFSIGTILYSIFATLGEVSVLKIQAATNQAIAGINVNDDRVNLMYLVFYLQSIKRDILDIGRGVAQNNINLSILRNLVVPLPPLPVQQQIAEVLDRASALIEKRKVQIAKMDLLIKSQFIEMFGDPVMNPKGWETHLLNEYITFLTSGSRGWSTFFSDAGKIFLTVKNVKDSHLLMNNIQYVIPPETKEAKRTKVQHSDLLISITADLGRTAVIPLEVADYGAYINQHLSLVRLDCTKVTPLFVSYFLESPAGHRQFDAKNQVGVKSGLNFEAINSLNILVPPLFFQNQFAAFVHQVEAQKALLQQSLDKLGLNYKSLMQKCFRGEVF